MVLNPQARLKVWDEVRNASCTLCPLHETARTVCLLGDGPVPAKILVVGEAPGAREDDVERPFSGVAGQYLDKILSEVGLPRESLYITNSVRCRPPDNRTPTRSEIKACSVYMQREVQIVSPEYILVLGNVALQAILNTSGIMAKRGTSREILGGPFDGATAFMTIHPAAVLRNPGLEQSFRSDLMSFARLVAGTDRRPETKTAIVQSSKGLAVLLRKLAAVDTPIAFDVETGTVEPRDRGGLEPWAPDGVIHTVAFCWNPGESYVVSLEHPATKWDIPISRVYEALNIALAEKRMVGHNVKFDGAWMKRKGVNLYLHFDTKLAAHLLEENRPQGLKSLARTYLGADEYEAGISFDGAATRLSTLAIYNGKDADYTLRLYHIFRDELKKRPRLVRLFQKLSMPATRAFVDIEANGFPVDMERLEKRHRQILRKIEKIEGQLLETVPDELKEGGVNFRSPIFLGKWLFGALELPILEVGAKSGRPSTNESVLLRLRTLHPAASLLMELRKWQKFESTYTRNWLERTQRAGKPRLYTAYNLSGTVTGRLSSDMQQVPRDLLIRSIIGSGPGWRFIEADFSQVELRIAAMFSGDPALIHAFNSGADPHRETAVKILNKPPADVTAEERKMAKAVNFGFLYGMGARKFQVYAKEKYDTDVSAAEAAEFRKAFFDQYAALPRWHDRQRRLVRNLTQVSSPTGRIRHLTNINSTDEMVQGEAEREAINAPVQGFASDLTVLSMVILHQRLDPTRCHIIGNVHDSIMFEATDDYAEEAATIIQHVMEHLPMKRLFGYKMTVPIQAEVKISQHWSEHD
jgi:uracil-DNA glycosylase family 4